MQKAVFTSGSIFRHILVMTSASSIALVTMFSVDLVDMYFLSLLGQEELAAAIGFSGTLLFFMTALGIGLQIAMGALVARAEGQHQRRLAGRYCSSVMWVSGLVSALISLVVWFQLEYLLRFLGVEGKTLGFALSYSQIIVPAAAVLSVAMCGAAALRGIGDARRSMNATIGVALVNAALDPVFIFVCGWGIEGAALASVVSRFVLLAIAFKGLLFHRLPVAATLSMIREDLPAIVKVAGPAMLSSCHKIT